MQLGCNHLCKDNGNLSKWKKESKLALIPNPLKGMGIPARIVKFMSLNLKNQLKTQTKLSHYHLLNLQFLQLPYKGLEEALALEVQENPFLVWKKPKIASHFDTANIPTKHQGIQDHLYHQLSEEDYTEDLLEVADLWLDEITPEGFIPIRSETFIEKHPFVSLKLAKDALKAIQNCEPLGIGAFNSQECMLLQLKTYPLKEVSVVNKVLTENIFKWNLFISKEFSITEKEWKEALKFIKSHLRPSPIMPFETSDEAPKIPELILSQKDSVWEVHWIKERELKVSWKNPKTILPIDDKGSYSLSKEEKKFVLEKSQKAKDWVSLILKRKNFILELCQALVEYQKEALDKNSQNLKSLDLKTLSLKLNVHISTISRALRGKYVETPWGIWELKDFCSKKVNQSVSQKTLHQYIKQIISLEETALSDEYIRKRLEESFSIYIARRTVSKHRKMLGYSSSFLRIKSS